MFSSSFSPYNSLEKTLNETKHSLTKSNFCSYATSEHTYWVMLRLAEANHTIEGTSVLKCLLENASVVLANRYGSFLLQTFIAQDETQSTRQSILNSVILNLVEYANNEHGSKVINALLDSCDGESQRQTLLQMLVKNAFNILNSEPGSALLQKCLDMGSKEDFKAIFDSVLSFPAPYGTSEHGSRVILKIFSSCSQEKRETIIKRLLDNSFGGGISIVNTLNGSMLIQKCIDAGPETDLRLILECVTNLDVVSCATNEFGYTLLLKIFDECEYKEKSLLLSMILVDDKSETMICNQYGSYLIEKCLDFVDKSDLEKILNKVRENLIKYATNEFGQFVVRKLIDSCGQKEFINEMINHLDDR
jgi:hypothetical protein